VSVRPTRIANQNPCLLAWEPIHLRGSWKSLFIYARWRPLGCLGRSSGPCASCNQRKQAHMYRYCMCAYMYGCVWMYGCMDAGRCTDASEKCCLVKERCLLALLRHGTTRHAVYPISGSIHTRLHCTDHFVLAHPAGQCNVCLGS
jgi:hypothetical protein